MQFGFYAPVPHVTVGSAAIDRSVAGALRPLAPGASDPAFELTRAMIVEGERLGFDIVLFAERHLGADLEAWVLGAAIAPSTSRIRTMIAVHPGLWHPAIVAKMAASLDRIAPGRMAIISSRDGMRPSTRCSAASFWRGRRSATSAPRSSFRSCAAFGRPLPFPSTDASFGSRTPICNCAGDGAAAGDLHGQPQRPWARHGREPR